MIILKKEECYCCVKDFYACIAKKMKIDPVKSLTAAYNCTKISVTKPVQDEIWRFYKEHYEAPDAEIAMHLLCCGPKADLEGSEYAADPQDGFIIGGKEYQSNFPVGELVATAAVVKRMQNDLEFSEFVIVKSL